MPPQLTTYTTMNIADLPTNVLHSSLTHKINLLPYMIVCFSNDYSHQDVSHSSDNAFGHTSGCVTGGRSAHILKGSLSANI